MRRLAGGLLLAAVGWVPAVAGPARGEEPSATLRLELVLSRRPPAVVHPAPDAEMAEEAAQAVIAKIRARERAPALIREVLRVPSRRPDLHYDLWSGIQTRNINKALRALR